MLTLLLLFSQQLGIAHALTHLTSPPESSSSRDEAVPDEIHCATCLAFASIGSALSDPHHFAFACRESGEKARANPAPDLLSFLLRAFNPRAPPSFS